MTNKIGLKKVSLVLCFLVLLRPGYTTWADSIAIDNPSFEADVLDDGYILNTITGWDTSLGVVMGFLIRWLLIIPTGQRLMARM